jgi:RNA polymerase sigma-70 factor (ECF subfamily)
MLPAGFETHVRKGQVRMTVHRVDTDILLRRARSGDDAAVNQLLLRNRSRLRNMIEVRLDPRLAARIDPSDVVQETLLEAHRRLDDYLRDQPIPFYPWLRQIAWERLLKLERRHLATRKRSVSREVPLATLLSDDSVALLARRLFSTNDAPHGRIVRAELRSRVRAALDQLSESDREIVILRYMEQLTLEEISGVLKLGESAVKMRHLRALQRLRVLLEDPSNH